MSRWPFLFPPSHVFDRLPDGSWALAVRNGAGSPHAYRPAAFVMADEFAFRLLMLGVLRSSRPC